MYIQMYSGTGFDSKLKLIFSHFLLQYGSYKNYNCMSLVTLNPELVSREQQSCRLVSNIVICPLESIIVKFVSHKEAYINWKS